MPEAVIKGIGVGSTPVKAEVFRMKPPLLMPAFTHSSIYKRDEMFALKNAINAHEELLMKKSAMAKDEQLAGILIAQASLVADPELLSMANTYIEEGWDSTSAIQMAINDFRRELEGVGGEFGERVADLDEIAYRVVSQILGRTDESELPTTGRYIIVAQDLSPMETVNFTDVVVGVATERGGPTSHTAIVCRQRGIPALVACRDLSALSDGDQILLDPLASQIILNGNLEDVESESWWLKLPPTLLNHHSTRLMANIGSIEDARDVRTSSVAGVGLLRTELFYLSRDTAPTREEQTGLYTDVLMAGPDGEIIFRTLDAGSDKPIKFLSITHEENPALGVRGYRIDLDHHEFLLDQLHAIRRAELNAKSHGRNIDVSIMAPMISTIEEAREFASTAREVGFSRVGIMIEVPAVALQIAELKGVLDFVSIGTNDLSQYLYAADRQNSGVAHFLDPWQPALLRILKLIASEAKRADIKVGVCGEAASDPLLIPYLVGLGISSLSCGKGALRAAEEVLSRINMELALSVVSAMEGMTDPQSARSAALDSLQRV